MRKCLPAHKPGNIRLIGAITVTALALWRCGNEGVDPFEQRFHFPIHATVLAEHPLENDPLPGIPAARYGYVLSANFDLEFNAGKVDVLDLKKLEELIAANGDIRERKLPNEVAHPLTGAVVKGAGAAVNSYGGQMLIHDGKQGPFMYVSSRLDNTIAPIRIEGGGRSLRCAADSLEGSKRCLSDAGFTTRARDPYGLAVVRMKPLSLEERAEALGLEHKDGVLQPPKNIENPEDFVPPPPLVQEEEDFLIVAHLRSPEILGIPIDRYERSLKLATVRDGFFRARSQAPGTVSIAVNPRTSDAFITLRLRTGNGVLLIQPQTMLQEITKVRAANPDEFQVPVHSYVDVHPQAGGTETRGIAISHDPLNGRTYLLAASRNPHGLIKVDITQPAPRMAEPTFFSNVEDAVALQAEPADVTAVPLPAGDIALVACTADNVVYVVDVRTFQVLDVVKNLGRGPYGIAAYKAQGVGGEWAVRALVVHFEESTVSVLGIDPQTRRVRVLGKIGAGRTEANDL